jgi:hypothetical protein
VPVKVVLVRQTPWALPLLTVRCRSNLGAVINACMRKCQHPISHDNRWKLNRPTAMERCYHDQIRNIKKLFSSRAHWNYDSLCRWSTVSQSLYPNARPSKTVKHIQNILFPALCSATRYAVTEETIKIYVSRSQWYPALVAVNWFRLTRWELWTWRGSHLLILSRL